MFHVTPKQTIMASDKLAETLSELNQDELETLQKALEDDQFKKLLKDYADEINDPENRKIYEKEITELEKQRGVDVTFLQPKPCYVMKTSVNGEQKAFINISTNRNIGQPDYQLGSEADERGYKWSIPFSLAPPKEDLDKEGRRCVVYDVVFHMNALSLAERNPRFKKMIEETALDGIERSFKVQLDRKNIRYPKMQFKGTPIATVIRKKNGKVMQPEDTEFPEFKIPYPELKENTEPEHFTVNDKKDKTAKPTQPKYTVKYRDIVDLKDYAYNPGQIVPQKNWPKDLVIEVELPLLNSVAGVDLNVLERSLTLKSEKPSYLLELKLTYPVDPNESNAKFDLSKKKLIITLPVKVSTLISTESVNEIDTEKKLHDNSEDNMPCAESIESTEEMINNPSDTKTDHPQSTANNSEMNCDEIEIDDYGTKCEAFVQNEEEEEQEIGEPQLPKIKYSLPTFHCKQTDDSLVFILEVANVSPDSVVERFFEDDSVFRVNFFSLGLGFVPFHFGLCVKCPPEKSFSTSGMDFDITQDNAVLRLIKHPNHHCYWDSVWVGVDNDNLEEVSMITTDKTIERLKDMQKLLDTPANDAPDKTGECKIMQLSEDEVVFEIQSLNHGEERQDGTEQDKMQVNNNSEERQKEITELTAMETSGDESSGTEVVNGNKPKPIILLRKSRSVSESSDDLSPVHKPRGILKIRNYRRSFSESSDDISWSSQDLVGSPDADIPEEMSGCEDGGARIKKSVRFNEVVSRNLFRSNSSILGQRKKNQRKQKAKKRATQRKLSESEGSEGENDIHSPMGSVDNISSAEDISQDSNSGSDQEKQTTAEIDVREQKDQNIYKGSLNSDTVGNSSMTVGESGDDSVDSNNVGSNRDINANHSEHSPETSETEIRTTEIVKTTNEGSDENANQKVIKDSTVPNTLSDTNAEDKGLDEIQDDNPTEWKQITKRNRRYKNKSKRREVNFQNEDSDDESYVPKTVLSWKDDEIMQTDQYKSNCPINFTNSVLYELDV